MRLQARAQGFEHRHALLPVQDAGDVTQRSELTEIAGSKRIQCMAHMSFVPALRDHSAAFGIEQPHPQDLFVGVIAQLLDAAGREYREPSRGMTRQYRERRMIALLLGELGEAGIAQWR